MPVIRGSMQDFATLDTAQATIAAGVNFTATSSATANVLMTLGPIETAGMQYIVELCAPTLTKGTTNASLELFVDGVFNQTIFSLVLANIAIPGFSWRSLVTLGVGVHTLTVRGFVDAGTGTLGAGTGATGQPPNALLLMRPA